MTYRFDAEALHSHGSFPQPRQRPAVLRFFALRMEGVSETNLVQCLYFFFTTVLPFASAIHVAYHSGDH